MKTNHKLKDVSKSDNTFDIGNKTQWIGLHEQTEAGDRKRAAFVLNHVFADPDEDWVLDSLMMLCEAFKLAAAGSAVEVEDLADHFQREIFKHTRTCDRAEQGYMSMLRTGTRDYHHERKEPSMDQTLQHVADYLAREPERRAELRDALKAEEEAKKAKA